MIRSIRLFNWRSHSDTFLKFSHGTNLLVGIMGSGKSAVLDGISFALFGTFPALERRQLKLEDIVRYNENTTRVMLEFSWNGSDYKVMREIGKRNDRMSSRAELYRDGTLLETGGRAVSERIVETIGVDYDLFTRAIYSEQNNIDYFLSLDPRRRKEEFDRLLGLDRFEKARANTVTITNKFEAMAQALFEKYDEKRVEQLRKTIMEYEEKESKINAESESLKKTFAKVEKEVRELSIVYVELEKKRKRIEELGREIAELKGRVASLEEGLKRVDIAVYNRDKAQLAELRGRLKMCEEALLEDMKKEKELSNRIVVIETRIKEQVELQKKLEELNATRGGLLRSETLENIQRALSDAEKKMLEKTSEKNTEMEKVKELRELLKHLSSGMTSCPLCESELGPEGITRILRKKEGEIRSSEKRVALLAKEIEETERSIRVTRERVKKIEFINERIAVLTQGLVDVSELIKQKEHAHVQLTTISETTKKRESEIAEIRQKIENLLMRLKGEEEMLRREETAAAVKKRLAVLESEQEKIKFDEKEYEEVRRRLESGRLECERLAQKIEYLEKEKKMMEEGKEIYKRELDEMRAVYKKATSIRELIEELKIYKNALLETQTTLRKGLIDAINTAMNDIWRIFYPYNNYKSIRIEVSEKDYVLEVLENEVWKPLEIVASGGERACAALTLRVALAMILTPNLSWLILDEPTHNLDAQAIALLSETLQVKVPQVVKQTFVITHEESLIGADFSTTYRFSRDKEHGGPTKVETI
ncbi:MAG: SMC family ATPase [Candidatus Bilamarchaeaceae archaeon]